MGARQVVGRPGRGSRQPVPRGPRRPQDIQEAPRRSDTRPSESRSRAISGADAVKRKADVLRRGQPVAVRRYDDWARIP